MRRALVLMVVLFAACSSGSDPGPVKAVSPSATAALEDFNVEWCDADFMHDQGKAIGRMPIDELAGALGNCS